MTHFPRKIQVNFPRYIILPLEVISVPPQHISVATPITSQNVLLSLPVSFLLPSLKTTVINPIFSFLRGDFASANLFSKIFTPPFPLTFLGFAQPKGLLVATTPQTTIFFITLNFPPPSPLQ